MRISRASVAAAALMVPVGAIQKEQTLREERQLRAIVTKRVVVLPDSFGKTWALMAVDSKRRYIQPSWEDGRIRVFDSTGRLVASVGGRGRGPGEFPSIFIAAVGENDSIYVLDVMKRRTVLAPGSYKYVRTEPALWIPQLPVYLGEGKFLLGLNQPMKLDDGQMYQNGLGLLPRDGVRKLRRFGFPAKTIDQLGMNYIVSTRARPCRSKDGMIWSPYSAHYDIEKWTQSGKLATTLHAKRGWFREVVHKPDPQNRIVSCSVDGSGLLWLLILIPRAGIDGDTLVDGRGIMRRTEMDALYRTRIEVIDPRRGAIVASQLFDWVFMEFLDGTRVYQQTEDGAGEPIILVSQLELSGAQ
jgi:hypothetical protein